MSRDGARPLAGSGNLGPHVAVIQAELGNLVFRLTVVCGIVPMRACVHCTTGHGDNTGSEWREACGRVHIARQDMGAKQTADGVGVCVVCTRARIVRLMDAGVKRWSRAQ